MSLKLLHGLGRNQGWRLRVDSHEGPYRVMIFLAKGLIVVLEAV